MTGAAPSAGQPAAPLVTVIMPTYKRAHVITRAIASVLAQTFRDLELIVVDDASPDNTADVIATIQDPRLRYLRLQVNGGVSHARNEGIRAASASRYLAYLDDDDEWVPTKLQRQLELFDSSGPDLGIVGCARVDYDKSGAEVIMPEARGCIYEDLLARRARGYGANAVLVRRSDPDMLYDESLSCLEDAEYMFRLSRQWRADFVPEVLLRLHREDDGPHLWNHAASVKGHMAILRLYERDITAKPAIYSYYCFCIGRELWALGRYRECREWLTRGARASNFLRMRLWWAGSILGKNGLRVCRRLVPVRPPE